MGLGRILCLRDYSARRVCCIVGSSPMQYNIQFTRSHPATEGSRELLAAVQDAN